MKNRVLLLLGISWLMVDCAGPARTPDEFRDGVRSGAAFTRMEKTQVSRSFASIYKSLETNSKACLNKTVVKEGTVSMGKYAPNVRERTGTKFSSQMEKSKHAGSLMVKKELSPAPLNQPDGGFYYTVVDLKELGKNQTEVVVYGTTIDKIPEGILEWAKTGGKTCPDLE